MAFADNNAVVESRRRVELLEMRTDNAVLRRQELMKGSRIQEGDDAFASACLVVASHAVTSKKLLDGLIEPKRDDGGRGAGIVDGDAHVSEGMAREKVIENSLPDGTEPVRRGQHFDVASSAEILRFD